MTYGVNQQDEVKLHKIRRPRNGFKQALALRGGFYSACAILIIGLCMLVATILTHFIEQYFWLSIVLPFVSYSLTLFVICIILFFIVCLHNPKPLISSLKEATHILCQDTERQMPIGL